jgi:hypothetical protein
MRKLKTFVFFIASMMMGYAIATQSWDGWLYVYLGEFRYPAAVRSIHDYSALDRKALFTSIHKQMLKEARLEKKQGYIGLTMGHPLFKRGIGTSDFACSVQGRTGMFDHIELTFMGVGISEGGEPPTMTVTTPCVPGKTLNRLQTIWVPTDEIFKNPAKDQELKLNSDQPMTVSLKQIPNQWPEQWVLWSVRLFNEDKSKGKSDDSYLIDAAKIREASAKTLSFEWKK